MLIAISRFLYILLVCNLSNIVSFPNKTEIYRAYITNRMDEWKNLIDRIESGRPEASDQLLELVNYQYGYVGYCIEHEYYKEAEKYLRAAENNSAVLEKRNYDPATLNAYRCAFYGFRIRLNNLMASIYGIKSIEFGRKAIALDRENYFVCMQYGNILFNMPEVLGGSKLEGIKYFLKAREIIERKHDEINGNWNYLSLLVLIGQSYSLINDHESAKRIYDEILNIEPEFIHVRDELYPELVKKLKI